VSSLEVYVSSLQQSYGQRGDLKTAMRGPMSAEMNHVSLLTFFLWDATETISFFLFFLVVLRFEVIFAGQALYHVSQSPALYLREPPVPSPTKAVPYDPAYCPCFRFDRFYLRLHWPLTDLLRNPHLVGEGTWRITSWLCVLASRVATRTQGQEEASPTPGICQGRPYFSCFTWLNISV
jgi:hypothetical protein